MLCFSCNVLFFWGGVCLVCHSIHITVVVSYQGAAEVMQTSNNLERNLWKQKKAKHFVPLTRSPLL